MQTSNDLAVASTDAWQVTKKTNARWLIVVVLFFITVINYADHVAISLAGPIMVRELNFDSVTLGYVFSAFGWSYAVAQIPGGWFLDRFGSKLVYATCIFIWSMLTWMTGAMGFFSGFAAVVCLFSLRFLIGVFKAPVFPANSRIVASWFPASERATASAVFSSAQYAATVFFAPLIGWLIRDFGWRSVYVVMGALGMVFLLVWRKLIHDPKDHPLANEAELHFIEQGGALINMDQERKNGNRVKGQTLAHIKQLLTNRMMVGIYLGQYFTNALTYFYITWFPVYLVREKHMSILKAGFVSVIPAVCGFAGGLLGGVISDAMLKRGFSLTVARKTPIVIGMLLSMTMIACNYINVEAGVIFFLALSYFGKGVGAQGWALNADTAPRQIAGLSGGVFNTCGNISSITTPIAIGYIVQSTGSFNGALVLVGLHGLAAIAVYLLLVGEVKRVEMS